RHQFADLRLASPLRQVLQRVRTPLPCPHFKVDLRHLLAEFSMREFQFPRAVLDGLVQAEARLNGNHQQVEEIAKSQPQSLRTLSKERTQPQARQHESPAGTETHHYHTKRRIVGDFLPDQEHENYGSDADQYAYAIKDSDCRFGAIPGHDQPFLDSGGI